MDPNQYMSDGRTVGPYAIDCKNTVHTVGVSWIDDPYKPKADTSMPVLVHNVHYAQPQLLQPEEAEMLLGYPSGATAGRAVTPIQRLHLLGDSCDNCTSSSGERYPTRPHAKLASPPNSPACRSEEEKQRPWTFPGSRPASQSDPKTKARPVKGQMGLGLFCIGI